VISATERSPEAVAFLSQWDGLRTLLQRLAATIARVSRLALLR
jgi:hypothetical protein